VSNDLMEWLTAQINHDEQIARQAATTYGGAPDWRHYIIRDELNNHTTHAMDVAARTILAAEEPAKPDDEYPLMPAELVHIALHDPAHVLRQVAAHRRILARHTTHDSGTDEDGTPWSITYCGHCNETHPCGDLADLASIYAERPGYDPTWVVE